MKDAVNTTLLFSFTLPIFLVLFSQAIPQASTLPRSLSPSLLSLLSRPLTLSQVAKTRLGFPPKPRLSLPQQN